MASHLTPDLVEQYVIGALEGDSARFVEAHVEGCADCAALLAKEARLEAALYEVGELANVVPLAAQRRRRRLSVAAAVVAVAAGLLLVVGLSERPPPPEKRPRVLECTAEKDPGACVARGQFDGVITIGPGNQLLVPRYDQLPEPEAQRGTP
ncbi:MAG: zf-HC2 domain-containing protein [Myxococcales bacterium]|nr:zf-HC2 domain-containing protein [Myxococcales bacterium]